MTERYAQIDEFNQGSVTETLAAEMKEVRDFTHGDGTVVNVANGKAVLEVFPAVGVARVTTEHARVEVHRVPGFSVDEDKSRVVFEQGPDGDRTRLIVRGDGKVSFYPILKATQAAVTEQSPATDTRTPEPSESAAEAHTAPAAAVVDGHQETGEMPLVTLQGRLGRDPWFSGGEDSPIGGFPLAVNADSQTTWHKVVVFDDLAVSLREQNKRGDIRKGRLVDVTGQTVTREEETARGTKKVVEFHASEVSRVRATARPR